MKKLYKDDLQSYMAEAFKDPDLKATYDAMEDEFRLIEIMIDARQRKKMTQAQLAKETGMQQEAIARIESGKSNPNYKTLARVAKAFNMKIAFVPAD